MVRRVFDKENYKEVELSHVRGDIKYYLLRVNPQEQEDGNIIAIEELYNHYPTDADKADLYNAWLSMEKSVMLNTIVEYANSSSIKVFSINDVKGWIDSDDRGSIRRAAADKADEGRDVFTLYLNEQGIEMSPAKVEEILKSVEVYASDCHDAVEAHKAIVRASDNIEFVNGYDYKTGYGEYPKFTI